MQVIELTLEGSGLKELPHLINEKFTPNHIQYYDKAVIISKEKYYIRTNSNLLAVLVISYKKPDFCNIEIISGGGSAGLIGFDWGAEGNMKNQLLEFLNEIASANKWKIKEIVDPKEAEENIPRYRRYRERR
jgi:hypothetical protein